MEGVEGGGAEKLFHAPRRKCITGIAAQTFTEVHAVSILELVRGLSAKWWL